MNVEFVFYGLVLIVAAFVMVRSSDCEDSVTQATVFLSFVAGMVLLVVGTAQTLARLIVGG